MPQLDALPPARPQADWIALIASADFFFNDSQNESMAENLRERVRYLAEKASRLAAGLAVLLFSKHGRGRSRQHALRCCRPRPQPTHAVIHCLTAARLPGALSPLLLQGEDVEMLFVCEPAWLEKLFPAEAAKCKRPAVALVCPDRSWMT